MTTCVRLRVFFPLGQTKVTNLSHKHTELDLSFRKLHVETKRIAVAMILIKVCSFENVFKLLTFFSQLFYAKACSENVPRHKALFAEVV